MIALFTDFGLEGPYVGQIKAVLHRLAPSEPVVDLLSDAPAWDVRAAAYLLAGYSAWFPPETIFLCVVDPGVGDPARPAVVLRAGEHWFVGPGNGLFNVVGRRAGDLAWWEMPWASERLSASFHGRDLFAPMAAALARREPPQGRAVEARSRLDPTWPDDLARVVYVDHFGNCMVGVRAKTIAAGGVLRIGQRALARVRTFSAVAPGEAFWYENANGLAEIAVNLGRASDVLGLAVGDEVAIEEP